MAAIELVTIGTELLLGFTIDTNGAEIGRSLAQRGIQVVRRTSVADEAGPIRQAIADALGRTGLVLTTGGLGPTADDKTKQVVAELFDLPLHFDDTVWAMLEERFARLRRVPAASNRSQAYVPRGATVLPNRWGTAPGLWVEGNRGVVIMLPGVPGEMRRLLEHEVLPRLAARAADRVILSRTVRTTGIPESSLAERLGDLGGEIAPLSLAFLPGVSGVDLRLTAWALPQVEAEHRLEKAVTRVQGLAAEFVYGQGDDDLAALVLDQARHRGLRLATAESCTGGLVGARLTAVPGSSEVYVGGLIAYHNDLKETELGIARQLLDQHGAVSEPVVRAMAEGACQSFSTDLSIAVTGVAGPGGGSAEKPVGLVWFAVSVRGAVRASCSVFPGTRQEIRERAAQAGLFLLHRQLRGG